MQFSELSLHLQLSKTLDHLAFSEATEIQQKTIPVAMVARDVVASSKTGSGKTLAYILPILHRMLTCKPSSKRDPRAVILAPTRELANQVYAQLRLFIANTQYTAVKLIGGDNFNDQAKLLRKYPRIIVATPGRLVDHLKHRHIYLNGLEMLVFDEADRMLDLGFAEQLEHIHKAADHRKRQTMMFSATMDNPEALKLGENLLNNPIRIAVGAGHDEHKDIEQTFYLADHLDHKKQLLQHIIKDSDKQIIIFIATRDDTDLLAAEVNELGLKAIAISGNLSQSKRNQAIDEFSRNRHQVLVTTDIAARGLDLRHVGIVINFDMPKHAEEYVHRIGRTGRAGYKGVAYSLVSRKDWQSFEQVQGFLQLDITFAEIDGLTAKFKGFEPGQKVNQPAAVSAEKTKQAKRNTKKTKSSKVKRTVKMLAPKIDIDKPPVKKR